MKGIVLAGGTGTRLYPVTRAVSKQLLPVYDKPMVHYPLSTLMLAGIREVLLISTPQDLPSYKRLLGDGREYGLQITYKEQASPGGIAQAFLIGEEFIGDDPVALVLGDNIHYGHDMSRILRSAAANHDGATIFGYQVRDPQRYGVAVFSDDGKVIDIEEKPDVPKSDVAITGLYFYDSDVVDVAKNLEPSPRGELEITDVNRSYLDKGRLKVRVMGRGHAWLDTGTHESLLDAANFIRTLEKRQSLKLGCLEEVAFRMGFIDREGLLAHIEASQNSEHAEYLRHVLDCLPNLS